MWEAGLILGVWAGEGACKKMGVVHVQVGLVWELQISVGQPTAARFAAYA